MVKTKSVKKSLKKTTPKKKISSVKKPMKKVIEIKKVTSKKPKETKAKTVKKITPKKTSLKTKIKKHNPIIEYILNNKKFVLFVVIALLLITVSTSYAYYMFSLVQEESSVVSADCFKITYNDSNDINLANAMPISESAASSLIPYTFTIKNVCKHAQSYDVTIEDLDSSTLNLNYVRYKLDNDASAILGSISQNAAVTLSNANTSRTLKSAILLPNEQITYNLKLWLNESTTAIQAANTILRAKVVILTTLNKSPYNVLTINPNNGDEEYSVNVVKGRAIGSITEPTKEGYSFDGWFDSNDNEITSSTILSSDLTITAKWTINE